MEIRQLKPNRVWKHFEAINNIPRASTKEEKIIKHMVLFGKSLNLETTVDSIGNVIIKKPGTRGKENDKTIVLQGHLDMVHQKTMDSKFNFDAQGIDMYIDGDWIKAKETTLGADNGIGVAIIMGVLFSNDIEHPPIEALFTVDEEMGMTGAMALKSDQLTGDILLNLDSEEDDEITIGCAGGVDVEINGVYSLDTLNGDFKYYEVNVTGLTGGHSGVDIHLNQANAIRLFSNYIIELDKEIDIYISKILAGTLTNVIPRNCMSILAIKETDILQFETLNNNIISNFKAKYKSTDKNLDFQIKPINESFFVAEQPYSNQLIKGISTMPNGVFSLTKNMDELVQTSNNIAKIDMQNGVFNIACHTRSSVDLERDTVVQKIKESFPFESTKEIGPYPGWEPKPNSNLLKIAKTCYKSLFEKEPLVKSIHAGLECGILSGTYPKMEMISIGPNITGAHSPNEQLQISSTQKFWKFLVEILKTI